MAQFPSSLKPPPEEGQSRKYFTLAEARRALPLVKRIALDIQANQSTRLHLHAELSSGLSQLARADQERLEAEFERATERLEALIEELTRIGVELKDATRVLLDFPALHEGREILLCWKADEEDILYWHEPQAGFAGRKPVSLLDQ